MEIPIGTPIVEDGEYIDDDGCSWVTRRSISIELRVDATTITNNLPCTAPTLEGRNLINNSPVVIYRRADIEDAVAHLLAIPDDRNVTKKRVHTPKDGNKYASAPVAARMLGMSDTAIRRRKQKVALLPGRDQQGVVDLVSIDDLKEDPTIKARQNSEMIRVDANGYYTAPDGEVWATVDGFFGSLPANTQAKTTKSSVLIQAQKHCRSLPAIDRIGRPNAQIFPVKKLQTKALALINNPKKVDKKTGYYSEKDDKGREIMRWSTKNMWLTLLGVTKFALNKGLEKTYKNWENVPRIQGVGSNGGPEWLYSEATMNEILAYIFQDEIQSENGQAIIEIQDDTGQKILKVYRRAIVLYREVFVTVENIRKRLIRASCPTIKAIDRHSGEEEELFDYDIFRQIFAARLMTVTHASTESGLTTNAA